jgi:hypothetical protein
MAKSVTASGPKVPSGGRMNPVDAGSQKLPKVKLPAKGSSPKETSTRKSGPK